MILNSAIYTIFITLNCLKFLNATLNSTLFLTLSTIYNGSHIKFLRIFNWLNNCIHAYLSNTNLNYEYLPKLHIKKA